MSGPTDGPQRQATRFRAAMRAEVRDGAQTLAFEAQNLSRTGVLLFGDLKPPPGRTLDLELIFAPRGLTVRLPARVIRVEPDAERGGMTIALEFVDMDDSRRAAIEVLVARLLEAPAGEGPFDHVKPGAPPQEIKKALESIPLPQRIALASRAGLKEREILRLDTQPAVLDTLAHNPGLGVEEARALAASVYLLSSTLDALANDLRFREDGALRMAVVAHPRVSLATAEKLAADLKLPDVKKLLAKPGLSQVLRDKLLRRTLR